MNSESTPPPPPPTPPISFNLHTWTSKRNDLLLINLHVSPRSLLVLLNYCHAGRQFPHTHYRDKRSAEPPPHHVKVQSLSDRFDHRSFRHLLPGSNKSRPICHLRLFTHCKQNTRRFDWRRTEEASSTWKCAILESNLVAAHCEECLKRTVAPGDGGRCVFMLFLSVHCDLWLVASSALSYAKKRLIGFSPLFFYYLYYNK